MADGRQIEDLFSIPMQIERCEQRIARQREIVDDLVKFNAAGPAKRLLAIMEHTLAKLRELERELGGPPAEQPAPVISS